MHNEQHSIDERITADNYKIFAYVSRYLNDAPDLIQKEEIEEIVQLGVTEEYAFAVILASAFGLDIVDNEDDKQLFNDYFEPMIHKLDAQQYRNNPYYQNISFPSVMHGSSELKVESYEPYEGFVCNDINRTNSGRQIPQIGFFDTAFQYPAVLEHDRIWMTVTPNEIETMKEPIEQAFGNVLTYGLGLGYYAYMVSEKENVDRVTIVEMNEDVISLFKTHILPQFQHAHKITIVQADAFEYAEQEMAKGRYDVVFADIWHDVSDGLEMYLKMKTYEKLSPSTIYTYWIEQSILCYL